MAQVKIVLDVGNADALQKVNEVNSKLVELQVNGASVSVGNPEQIKASKDATTSFNKEIDKTGQAAKQAGQQATQATNSLSEALQQTEKDARGLKGTLTTAGKQAARGAKDIIHSFINPITIALVAFEAATKVFTYFFNNLTENIDKLTARGQSTIKTTQKAIRQTENRTKASKDLISQLEALNKQQSLTAVEQKLGQSIIARLNREYKDLGITIDETTGKYVGLYEAQVKLDKINRNAQQRGLRKQLTAQKDIINAELKKVLGSGIELGSVINGDDLFTFAERLGGTFGAENANLLAQKWGNGTNLNNVRDVIQQLMDGLSSRSNVAELQGVLDAIDAALEYNQKLIDLNSTEQQAIDANNRLRDSFKEQEAAIKSTKDAIKSLQDQYNQNQEANSLAGLDPEDRANAIRSEIEQLEKRNELLDKAQEYGQGQLSNQKNSTQLKGKEIDNLRDRAKGLEEQIKKQQDLIEKINSQSTDPTTVAYHLREQRVNTVQSRITPLEKQLAEVKETIQQAEVEYKNFNDTALEYEQGIAKVEQERAQNLLDIQQKSQELAQLEKQIAEEQRRAEEQRLEAERKLAEAEAEKLKNYKDYVDGLYNKQLEALNEIIGKKEQSVFLEAKLNAEKKLGRELTEQELETIKNYAQLDAKIGQFKQGQSFKLDTGTVITNDIARKGGYASSVVVDRSVDVNQQILQVQKSQKDILTNIQTLMDRYSVIQ